MGGVGIQEVSAGLSNNPSRSDRDGSVSAAASVAMCFGFDLFVSESGVLLFSVYESDYDNRWSCGAHFLFFGHVLICL